MAEIIARPRKPLTGTTMTVLIKPRREFHVRLWLAIKLFQMAGWLLDCNVRFGEDDEQ